MRSFLERNEIRHVMREEDFKITKLFYDRNPHKKVVLNTFDTSFTAFSRLKTTQSVYVYEYRMFVLLNCALNFKSDLGFYGLKLSLKSEQGLSDNIYFLFDKNN